MTEISYLEEAYTTTANFAKDNILKVKLNGYFFKDTSNMPYDIRITSGVKAKGLLQF